MAKKKKQKKLLKQMRRDYKVNHEMNIGDLDDLAFIDPASGFKSPNVNHHFQEFGAGRDILSEEEETANMLGLLTELARRIQDEDTKAELEEAFGLVKALGISDKSEKVQALEKLSQQYPENFAIQMAYIEATTTDFTYDRIPLYKSFTELIWQGLEGINFPSWAGSDSAGYLHGLALLLETYFDVGLWTLAAEILDLLDEFLFEKDCPEHLLYLAAATYCIIYQPERVLDIYEEKLATGVFDPGLNLYAVIASLEEWNLETANTLFKDLMERDSEFASHLASETWLQNTMEAALTDFEAPFSFALFPLLRFLADKEIIAKELTRMYQDFQGKLSLKQKSVTVSPLPEFLEAEARFKLAQMFVSPALENLRLDKKRILTAAELQTFEDFAAWTEKEVLTIHGIGPTTIQQLKENGVVFKKG